MKIKSTWLLMLLFSSALIAEPQQLLVATTTSIENSGLLNYLIPIFKQEHNINVKIIATGTGKAIKLAKQGDVDMIIVHAPAKEEEFVKSGFGVDSQGLMYNYFLIVGPKDDPANVKHLNTAAKVFSNIQKTRSTFISRGDHSGTYFKELNIWQQSKQPSAEAWYKEVGQGMGKTLQIASELNAYTLVDQGTWIKLKDKLQLAPLYFNYNDFMMFNPYSVILVNPKKYPDVRYKTAQVLANWLTSKPTKKIINRYQVNGQQLFFAK